MQDTSIPRPPLMLTAPLRINILAATRNLAIEQLVERGGYDRLLFSNDVFVKAEAIVELLNTRDGVGCSISLTSRLVTDEQRPPLMTESLIRQPPE
ncbi:hypothetical protein B0H10DRAFT_2217570 [Mycena sp. CBHHK59/15]|nr:hypothetical protein B0H10DRAFT_2217570 [Mycena sp. CBHHK59/15]